VLTAEWEDSCFLHGYRSRPHGPETVRTHLWPCDETCAQTCGPPNWRSIPGSKRLVFIRRSLAGFERRRT
jgi:hypothetical protein